MWHYKPSSRCDFKRLYRVVAQGIASPRTVSEYMTGFLEYYSLFDSEDIFYFNFWRVYYRDCLSESVFNIRAACARRAV